MSKLSNFYQHKAALQQSGEFSDVSSIQWDALEEKLIREDLMPRLMQQIAPLLQEVQSALSININYNPEGTIALAFTRNCSQALFSISEIIQVTDETTKDKNDVTAFIVKDDNIAIAEESGVANEDFSDTAEPMQQIAINETSTVDVSVVKDSDITINDEPASEQEQKTKIQRKKSVGFRVTFPDGEIIYEKNGISTFVKALQKFGLSRLAKGEHGIQHAGYNLVGTKAYQYGEGEKRAKKQEIVGDYLIYINISNEDKIDDLYKLADLYHIPLQIHEMRESGAVLIEKPTQKTEEFKHPVPSIQKENTNPSKLDIKSEFLNYMEQRISHDSAVGYLRHLNNGVRKYINLLVDDKADSIFSFTTLDEVNLCTQLLEENEEYIQANDEQHHYYSASIKQWQKFVEKLNQI